MKRITALLLIFSCALIALSGLLTINRAVAREDIWFTPSLTLAGEHDDNVFISSGTRQSDSLTRLTPRLAGGFDNGTWTLNGSVSQDAERYSRLDTLNDWAARRSADVSAFWHASPNLDVNFASSYLAAPTRDEINANTGGVEFGRVRSSRRALSTGGRYFYSANSTITGEYRYSNEGTAIGFGNDMHELITGYEYKWTPQSTLLFDYAYRTYRFTNNLFDNSDQYSHTVTVGLAQQLDQTTRLKLQAGPRFFPDAVKPEVLVSLTHDFATSTLALDYTRSESVLAGVAGKVESELASAGFTQRIGTNFSFNLRPAYGTVTGASTTTTVRRMDFDAVYRFTPALSANASWQYTHQDTDLPFGTTLTIPRNVFTLGISIGYPDRHTTEVTQP